MADDPLETIRLSLMQDVLPVGMAVVARARDGGAGKVAEAFSSSTDPLEALRKEGEPAARSVRERLDKLSPGLGNPVVSVKVAVHDEYSKDFEIADHEELMNFLMRIETVIEELENRLLGNVQSAKDSMSS